MMQYNWHSENVHINSITILRDEKCAQEFMDRIYPYWSDSIIVSADGVFPIDEKLKELALITLSTNETLPVVVFDARSLENLSVASNKKLFMDEFFKNDMYRFDNSESVFNWNERSIAMFCFLWVSQDNYGLRPTHADIRVMFNPESIKWYHNLIY